MIAQLAMYDWPGERRAVDAIWRAMRDAMRAAGIDAPEALDRTLPPDTGWTRPDLLIGETCGLPYRAGLSDKVTLLGTLDYGLPGAPAGHYHSVIVARRDDVRDTLAAFDGTRLALNGADSQSGWAAMAEAATESAIRFSEVSITGAHADSARAVAEGRADIAALDANSWRLVERHIPHTAAILRVVQPTRPTPGLPLVTAQDATADLIRDTLCAALGTDRPDHAGTLGWPRFIPMQPAEYLALPLPPVPAMLTG